MSCADNPDALTIGESTFDQLSIGSDAFDKLTVGASTFTYLVIASFVQVTPDHIDDQSGVLDAYQLDEQPQLDE